MEEIKKLVTEAENQINEILNNLKLKIGRECDLSAEFFEIESEDGDYEVGYTYSTEVDGLELNFNPDNATVFISFKK